MSNPVLLNDLRKSWFRRRPVHGVALMAMIILVLTLSVAMGVSSLFGFSGNNYPLWRFPDLLLPAVAPVFAASAFAREHEQLTWQDVLLTRLTAWEILSGKFFACLLPTIGTIVVLLPPFAMILIISSVRWAQEPGPWLLAVLCRFLVMAVFYLSVGLVCSYHSTNARASLVVSYVAIALYSFISLQIWRAFFDFGALSTSLPGSRTSYYDDRNGLLSISKNEFGFSGEDLFYMSQSICLGVILFSYLLYQIRQRREPIT